MLPRRAFFNGNFQVMNAPGHSDYNSLQLRLQRRLSAGFTVLSAFTWSKSIDNTSGIRTSSGVGELLTPSDNYNLKAERGLSGFDFRRRWTTSMLYELPIGTGHGLLGNAGRAANSLIGGWQVGTILTLQDGFPLSAMCGAGSVQNNDSGCYPDNVGMNPNLPRSQQDPNHFFNTAAFVNRLPGSGFRYGNSGRNTIIGPGLFNLDFSLFKNNPIARFSETGNLQFRAEFFNVLNRTNFAPSSNLSAFNANGTPNTLFGQLTSTQIDNRVIQLALKLVW